MTIAVAVEERGRKTVTLTHQRGSPNNSTDLEDATEVYGDRETYDLLDSDNDCSDAGGHVYLAECGEVRCIYCSERVG